MYISNRDPIQTFNRFEHLQLSRLDIYLHNADIPPCNIDLSMTRSTSIYTITTNTYLTNYAMHETEAEPIFVQQSISPKITSLIGRIMGLNRQ